MLFKKLKTRCGKRYPHPCNPKIGEKTKSGFFYLVKTSIDGVKDIDIDAIASRLFRSIALPLTKRRFPMPMEQNIVGVQPMTSPVGLRFLYRDELELYNELV